MRVLSSAKNRAFLQTNVLLARTNYWRGPFGVLRKVSDLLYEINCGSRGKPQVIHVDRLRLQSLQILSGEGEEEHEYPPEELGDSKFQIRRRRV